MKAEARRRFLRGIEGLGVFAAALLLYAGIPGVMDGMLSHPFLHWDDTLYIVDNPSIRDLTWENLGSWFTSPYFGNYAPLHLASYALDYALWEGPVARGFHLTDALLHAGSAVFALLLFRRLLGPGLPALFAALLFAFHPVQLESVAWASQRKSTLSMFFLLPSMVLYLRHRDRTPYGIASGWPTPAYMASLAFFLLSLLSKGTGVVLPLIFLLYERLRDPRPRRRGRYVEVLPYLALSIALGLATIWAQSSAGALHTREAGAALWLTMTVVFRDYLRTLFFPVNLNNLYYLELIQTPLRLTFLLSSAILLGAAALTARWSRRSPRLAFWPLWFLVSLVPVSNLLPLTMLRADRYLYLPSLALAGLMAEGFSRASAGRAWRRSTSVFLMAAVVLCHGALTNTRLPLWGNAERLWRDSVRKAPRSHIAHGSLGETYFTRGDYDRALGAYREALRLQPKYGRGFFNIGFIEVRRGRLRAAAEALRKGLEVSPEPPAWNPAARKSYAHVHLYIGVQDMEEARLAEAEARFRRALDYWPRFSEAAFDLGVSLSRQGGGREAEAYAAFRRAAALRPDFYEAHREAGLVGLRGGASPDLAARSLRAALALRPEGPDAAMLRELLRRLGSSGGGRPG
jgi:tetratricopeptide (TPR) repeat protein